MGAHRRGRGLTLAALLLTLGAVCLGGCGGHGAADGLGTPIDGSAAGAAATPGAAGFALPTPDTALRAVPRSGSGAVLIRDGSDTLPGFTQLTVTESASLRFQPDWQPGGEFEQLSYAIYNFNLLGYTAKPELRLVWDEPPQDGRTLWVGLARWDKARWDWFRGPADGAALDIGAHTYTEYTEPATGAVLVAVVMLGDAQPLLYQVRLGTVAAPWPMAGHDPQHTCRSPYTGPATNALKWKFRTTNSDRQIISIAYGPDGTIYSLTYDCLFATSKEGTFKWITSNNPFSLGPGRLACDDSGTVYTIDDSDVVAIRSDGRRKWKFPPQNAFVETCSPPVIGSTGLIYYSLYEGDPNDVFAINSDGELVWEYSTGGAIITNSITPGPNGVAYVADKYGIIHAINPDGSAKWVYTASENFYINPVVSEDGTAYVGGTNGGIYAINPNGSLAWKYIADGSIVNPMAIGSDGAVYFCTCYDEYRLYCLEPSGELRWRSTNYQGWVSYVMNPEVGPNNTVLISEDQNMLEFTAEGDVIWSIPRGDEFRDTYCFGPDNTVYIGTENSGLVKAYSSERTLMWKMNSGSRIQDTPLLASSARIYLNNPVYYEAYKRADSRIYALDLNGNLLWESSAYNNPDKFSLGPDDSLYIVDWNPGLRTMFKCNREGGSIWSYPYDNTTYTGASDPVVLADGSSIISLDRFYALNAEGTLEWKSSIATLNYGRITNIALNETGTIYSSQIAAKSDGTLIPEYTAERQQSSVAIADDGTVYLTCMTDEVLALAPDGKTKHHVQLKSMCNSNLGIGQDGTVYVADWSATMSALNSDLTVKWEYCASSAITTSPAIDAAGTVYFGCDDHCLYAVNADGTLKWKYETCAPVRSSPAIGADGTVYFGSDDGFLYAIGPGEG